MPVRLYAKVTYGASGAPTLSTANSKGIASISRTSAGLYAITLQDVYNKFMHMSCSQVGASSGATAQAAPILSLKSETVSSTKIITIQFRAIDNSTATDPASGETSYFEFVLNNSSV